MTIEATPEVTAEVAPGWYTDPANEDSQRWWDGTQWTEHVSVAINGGPDLDLSPAGVAPVQEYRPLQPLTLTGPASQFHSNTHHSQLTVDRSAPARKTRRTALVVVLLAGALAAGGVIAYSLYSSTNPESPDNGTVNAPAAQVVDGAPASDAVAQHTRAVLMADVRKINSAMKSVKGKAIIWPSTLAVDPKKGTIATGDGTKLGSVPAGTVVSYSTSVDGTAYTLTVTDSKVNVGIRYASVSSEFTSF